MARNWLRINHEGYAIGLSWQRGQSNPRLAPAVKFEHPFQEQVGKKPDEQPLAQLRWYLEDYLRSPYGIFPDKAAKIEQKFQDWGEQLFELVFRSSEQARQFFQAATYEGLNQCELLFSPFKLRSCTSLTNSQWLKPLSHSWHSSCIRLDKTFSPFQWT
ncbi:MULTISPECIES: hypothetical protein [unclassified Coleofasciculus]|uniref:hypothetical protein n=1 Tax=unclassified Coleofasciculus TaxID=2692782 RepID=UPI0018827F54|nr:MULTISPECIES: hypothetical protein [unclassified Coleofasciculus]MBE9127012.1 hypothetical protein [Coleofasciculus sp. LEGE 07081]MBE9149119.1 hypothetical protein [Coleofasciculus sp. LEGE 07092]